MRCRARYQLMLDLGGGGRPRSPKPAPEELLKALGDLLIEAFGNQNNVIAAEREACDAFQDHA
jgi:hypothetical protein